MWFFFIAWSAARLLLPNMSDVPPANVGDPTGPIQKGRGVQGQYVYWITMSHPLDDFFSVSVGKRFVW